MSITKKTVVYLLSSIILIFIIYHSGFIPSHKFWTSNKKQYQYYKFTDFADLNVVMTSFYCMKMDYGQLPENEEKLREIFFEEYFLNDDKSKVHIQI